MYVKNRDPPHMQSLDSQRLMAHIQVQRSNSDAPCYPCGKDKWILSVDTGLKTYVTVICINTGDLFRIGHGTYREIKHHLDLASESQSRMSECIKNTDEVQRSYANSRISGLRMEKEMEADFRNRKKQTAQSSHEYNQFRAEQIEKKRQEAKVKKKVDNLIKITSMFLSGVGENGIVCFPINLCEQSMMKSKRIFKSTKQGIAHMRFGQLLRDLEYRCQSTGAFVWKVREDRTSKWCSACGRFCGYLGSKRNFKCPNESCLLHMDRDGGAARMIFILAFMSRMYRRFPRAIYIKNAIGYNDSQGDV